MSYTRKTRDEYQIQVYSGPIYGYEEVCSEGNRKEARDRLKEYRENQPQYPSKIVKKRVKLESS